MSTVVYVLGQERLPRQLGSWDLRGVYHDIALAIRVAKREDWFIVACRPDSELDVTGDGENECGAPWFPAREPVAEGFF